MAKEDSLDEYRTKRDFRRSPEPTGRRKKPGKIPVFVIQKHDASSLHYDFRLEIEGVLKSWAVPKGLSTDPREKRLAVLAEDHPLEYADFEGVIPDGEYGAGAVLVWDKGTFRNLREKDNQKVSMVDAFEKGHITIWLNGKKLKGGYALTAFKKKGQNQWLIVKMDDDEADARRNPVSTQPESVLTGRTIEEIAAEGKKVD
jgi:DNA ligase D-like protein (predicted 3'-phosphoesterase)